MEKKSYVINLLYAFFFGAGIWLASMVFHSTRHSHLPGSDFSIFYAASRLVLSGHPALVYNVNVHHHVIESIYHSKTSDVLSCFYPPQSLILFLPLSLLPYAWSFMTWMLLGLAFFVAMLRKFEPNKTVLFALIGFPGLFLNLYWGQNAFLIGALLLCFVYYLNRKAWIAGIALGLLFFKPQFAAFCMIAAIARRDWKCVVVSFVTVISLCLSSILIFGVDSWIAYFKVLKTFSEGFILSGWANTGAIQPTVYSLLRIRGVSPNIALVVQYSVSLAMASIIYRVWHRDTEDKHLAVAILVLGILLGLPYYMQYEMFLLIIPIVIYFGDQTKEKPSLGKVTLLAALWNLPLLGWIIAFTAGIQIAPIFFAILLSILLKEFAQAKNRECPTPPSPSPA